MTLSKGHTSSPEPYLVLIQGENRENQNNLLQLRTVHFRRFSAVQGHLWRFHVTGGRDRQSELFLAGLIHM